MSALAANALTGCGLFLAWVVYRLQSASSRSDEVSAARAVLLAVQHGMVGAESRKGWGAEYFDTSYADGGGRKRARQDYEMVTKGGYSQVLGVPTAPLVTLIGSPHAGDLIDEQTLYAASIALWHIENFNQLVQQQSQLVAAHLPDIADKRTRTRRRDAIARAFFAQSEMLHSRGVGNAGADEGWYTELCRSVEANIAALGRLQPPSRWHRYRQSGWLVLADITFTALLVALVALVIAQSV